MTEHHGAHLRQFVTLVDVQAALSITPSQAYALVRTGELRAIQVGGRGQWRIELTELNAYIERAYTAAELAIGNGRRGAWGDQKLGRQERP